MKLVDLFVKIANGEKVPDIIKFHGRIFKANGKEQNYYCEEEKKILEEFFIFEELNDEVEIIEEEDKVEQWGNIAIEDIKKCNKVSDLKKYIEVMVRVQNEIIEKINGGENV